LRFSAWRAPSPQRAWRALIHAESEHVAFRASEHVLAVSGIAPANQLQVSVNIDVKAGYIIDLLPADEEERQMIERQRQAKVIDAKGA
jgi:hypothetical protein